MKPSGVTEVSPKDVDDDTDNIYLASAIRLCMNRNRDENGNGKIDTDELKWYLPSSEQLDYIAMCHFSLYNPLLNINELYDESTMRDDTYGNKYIVLPEMPVESGYNAGQNGNLYTARTFVSSDYKKVATQEMINTKDYNFNNASSKPQEMRCVRNLGISDPETVAPDDIYQYNNYRFDMQHLDSRSLRSSMVTDEELDPNTFYSENNRPYKAFKVAKTIEYIRKNTHGFAANIYLHKALTTDINPCRTHVEDEDNGEVGHWRVPNLTELAMMLFYDLTLSNDNNRLLNDNTVAFVCNTVWDFTPNKVVWARAVTTRKEDHHHDQCLFQR